MEEGDLRVNYEQELNNLRNAQKNAAVADLQKTRDTSLSNLTAEEAKIRPEYASQRSAANANNRVAARNFQEYLANTGRANSGIGAQYEMSRQNSLQSGLNAINAAEAQSVADIARRRSDIENAYNTGLASANAQVEANYIQNLLDQRQQQWEREFAQKQFDEQVRQYNQNRQDQLNRAFSSGGGSGTRSSGGSSGKTGTQKQGTSSQNVYDNLAKASNLAKDVLSNTVSGTNNQASIFDKAANIGNQVKEGVNNTTIYNAAQPGEKYVKFVNGQQQIWMKTNNGKDYRVG
ncbi:MAG: hypothetical protein J6S67_10825 [Methanobrevibacter sp.]|nr:hypothetical protein [Methanobrevibacter sp.]